MINETLHTFISVTKNGSFNKAAEKLSLTAPAVMKQMNSLEKSIGAPLFERTNRGIRLTPAGESFLKDAKPSSGTQENPSSVRRSPRDKPLICRHAAHRRRALSILPPPSPLTGKKGTGANRRDATRTLRKPRGNPQKKFMKFSKRS